MHAQRAWRERHGQGTPDSYMASYCREWRRQRAEAAGLAADALDALRAFRGAPDVAAMADRAWGDARAVFQEAQTLRRAAEAGAARFDGRRWVGS